MRSELENGPEHEETLDALRNLAFALYKGCQYEPAETLLRRVVEGGRKAFGDDHLAVLETRLHCLSLFKNEGDTLMQKFAASTVGYHQACYISHSSCLKSTRYTFI